MRHGSQLDPPNRFERVRVVPEPELFDWTQEEFDEHWERRIEYLDDSAQSIVSENESPDIPFRYSVNPYRGCVHGCAYCYARNTHEYLGLNAGLDFETKIFVKRDAPNLLRKFLSRDSWQPEPLNFSGVTDCFQPIERRLKLTRGCLEVARDCGVPVMIVTKNALVARDVDLLSEMAARRLVQVGVSVSTLDAELARTMEPRTSIPAARLRTIRVLAEAGVPVRVMAAPMIPGLNDSELPAILEAARGQGATAASYTLLRLPITVEPVFREWLERTQPLKRERVEKLIQQTRGGQFNQSQWRQRMTGTGPIAEQIRAMFQVFRQKFGYQDLEPLDCTQFRPATPRGGQMRLF